MRRCNADALTGWATACLRAHDVPDDDARRVAQALVQTSLLGIDSHGIARLPHYLNRLAHGSILARPAIAVSRSGPATAHVQGGQGLGIVVAHRANHVAMEIAAECGVGDGGGVRRLALRRHRPVHAGSRAGRDDRHRFHALGFHRRALRRALALPGHQPHLDRVPARGWRARVPGHGHHVHPLESRHECAARGAELPPGVAVDGQGADAQDPQRPAPCARWVASSYGHKGYALALMIERAVRAFERESLRPAYLAHGRAAGALRRLGAFFIVIDPARFPGGPTLAATIEQMAQELAQQPGRARMPGDPEREAARAGGGEGMYRSNRACGAR